MKFLHAADLHLDSPLRGLERYEGAPVDEIRGATRVALGNLTELAIAENVAFVLIAGDIYDGDWKDYNTGLFFARQMARLKSAGIPVFMIRGNHDAASQITKQLRLADNVVEFGADKPATRVLDDLGVAIHGQSFAHQSVSEDLSQSYPAPRPGLFNIGLLHTSADGRPGHASYAPCTPGGLASRGYDYWALGHVHQREVLAQNPWIVFPGNIQGRHIREPGAKGCSLVKVERGQVVSVTHRELDVLRWLEQTIDISSATDTHTALDAVRTGLDALRDDARSRLLAIRVRLVGRSHAHSALVRERERLLNECRSLATELGDGRIWLEKIRLESLPESEPRNEGRSDALGHLQSFLRSAAGRPELIHDLQQDLADLIKRLPAELAADDDPFDLTNPETIARMISELEHILTPRLLAQGGR